MADTLHIRTRRKGSEYKDDLHHFTREWQEVEIGKVRGDYIDSPDLEVVEDKGHAKTTAVKPEAETEEIVVEGNT